MTPLKKFTLALCLISFATLTAQQKRVSEFGNPPPSELALKNYPKDPEASGVVLFERGKNSIELIDNRVRLIREVHRKIKVFDPKLFTEGTVEIYYYRANNLREKVTNLKAITHNGDLKTYITETSVFDVDETPNWSVKRFTFPNIKEGSILEYTYRIESPYFFNFQGWSYQDVLPKIYSEFNIEIPGNFVYNKSIVGSPDLLYINESSLKSHCFSIPGETFSAQCEIGVYAMKDIPAFKEEEFMLSKNNYLPRLNFELREIVHFNGEKEQFSKKWKDVDREIRYDSDTGRQLNYTNFFKNNIPENILAIPDALERARAIYKFIQKHYSWNGKYGLYSDNSVKEAFERKTGSISEINLSLINAFEAAELDSKIVLQSTRDNGTPTKLYPVITDFNYLITMLTIGNTKYFLDATDKHTPFGIVPFRALNKDVRIMDFKEGSYWHTITPHDKNIDYINVKLSINDDEEIIGEANEIHTGYMAISKRKEIESMSKDSYRAKKEALVGSLEISNYNSEHLLNLDEPLKESYSVKLETEEVGDNVYLYPFFLQDTYSKNMFTTDKRIYPIELGHSRQNTYMVSIDLKDKYKVVTLPTNRTIKLPEEAGSCTVVYDESNGVINLRFNFRLNYFSFHPEFYPFLKEFFTKAAEIQTKEPIVLEKI